MEAPSIHLGSVHTHTHTLLYDRDSLVRCCCRRHERQSRDDWVVGKQQAERVPVPRCGAVRSRGVGSIYKTTMSRSPKTHFARTSRLCLTTDAPDRRAKRCSASRILAYGPMQLGLSTCVCVCTGVLVRAHVAELMCICVYVSVSDSVFKQFYHK